MLPLNRIAVDPVRFQVRDPTEDTFVKERFQAANEASLMESLIGLVERSQRLDPIVVWQDPDAEHSCVFVIDGHHRYQAYVDVLGSSSSTAVPVQHLIPGITASQARAIAFDINKRQTLNMSPAEIKGRLFLMMIAAELPGSLRELEARWGISKSTLSRMQEKAREIRLDLQRQAAASGEKWNWEYVRNHAPKWREVGGWRKDDDQPPPEDWDEHTVLKLLAKLTKHFRRDVVAHRAAVEKAFERFLIEVDLPDHDEDGEEDEEPDF